MTSIFLLSMILAGAIAAMCLISGVSSRRSEELLRRQNVLLDAALNNMTQGLNMFDSAGRLVVSNEHYVAMYGLAAADVKPGASVRDLVELRLAAGTFFKTDPEQYAHELMTSIVERKPTRVTRELADGRFITVVNQPMPGGGWVVTHEDVSERWRAERELESTRHFLDTVVENVPAAIVVVIPVLMARTMSIQGIVQAQSGPAWNWFVFQPVLFIGPVPIPIPIIGALAFTFYLIAGLAEVNRTPFDHVEADSELTGGFTTEYSGMQFSLFFLAEYANAIALGLLGSALFLGGYHTGLGDAFDNLIWPLLPGVIITKAAVLFLVFVWVRGTLPRFRYDQLMQFAWKRMLPISLVLLSLSALFASLSSLLGPIIRLAPGVR